MPSVESNDDKKASIWILIYIASGFLLGGVFVFHYIKGLRENQAAAARAVARAAAAQAPAQAAARSAAAVSTNDVALKVMELELPVLGNG